MRCGQQDVLGGNAMLASDGTADRFHRDAVEIEHVGGDEHASVTLPIPQDHDLGEQGCQRPLGISLAPEAAHLHLPRGRRDLRLGIADGPLPLRPFLSACRGTEQTHRGYDRRDCQ